MHIVTNPIACLTFPLSNNSLTTFFCFSKNLSLKTISLLLLIAANHFYKTAICSIVVQSEAATTLFKLANTC